MIQDMGSNGEFEEFETTEDDFDRMWAEAEPVELGEPISVPHAMTVAAPQTFGVGATVRSIIQRTAPSFHSATVAQQ